MSSQTCEASGDPRPAVVQVLLPGADPDIRLATLERDADVLELRKVTLDSKGSLVMGNAARMRLSSIGRAEANGKNLVLRGGQLGGPALLELKLEDTDTAAAWAAAMKPRQPSSAAEVSAAAARAAVAGERTADTLRKLIAQQEEQLRLLESINERKEEQLLNCQRRLEQSLDELQKGQVTYTTQHQTLEKRQKEIDALCSMLNAANAAEAACLANEAEVARGAAAAARAGQPGRMSAALQQRAVGQRQSAQGGAAASAAAAQPEKSRSCPSSPGAGEKKAMLKEMQRAAAEVTEAAAASAPSGEGKGEEAAAVLAQLAALQNAKAHCEASLRKEQEEVHQQMQKLQDMMSALGIAPPQVSDSDPDE